MSTEELHPRRIPSLAYGFRFVEPDYISLQELSAAFYDLSVLYDTVALASIPEGAKVSFEGRFFWTRYGRPVPPDLRPYVLRARYESPLTLELAFLSAIFLAPKVITRWTTAINDVFDLRDRIRDRREDRREVRERRDLRRAEREARLRRLDLERYEIELRERELTIAAGEEEWRRALTPDGIETSQRELSRALAAPDQERDELLTALDRRGARDAYTNVRRRLRESPIEVEEAEIFEWTEDLEERGSTSPAESDA